MAAAYSLHQNLTPLGNYLHRMKAKLGPKAAAMATAHKTAVIFCTMVKNQVEYDETIWDARDAQSEKSLQSKLKRQAKQLGWGARMRMAWSRRPTTCGVDQAPPTTRPSPRDPRTPLSAARSVCRALPRFSGNEACESFPSSDLPANPQCMHCVVFSRFLVQL